MQKAINLINRAVLAVECCPKGGSARQDWKCQSVLQNQSYDKSEGVTIFRDTHWVSTSNQAFSDYEVASE